MEEGYLIQFTGVECTHCREMDPLVEKLEKELKIKVVKKEIWHDAKNQAEFMKLAEGKCEGIPFFFNKKSGKWICGSSTYEKLKEWAKS